MNRKANKQLLNKVRIIAGEHRSRQIRFPAIEGLRPTSDRIRETLFNWLQSDLPKSNCLDLFAGSGVLGIEALSRGAESVQFVELDRSAVDSLKENLAALSYSPAAVANLKAEQWLSANENKNQFDIVFIDPPYKQQLITKICNSLIKGNFVKPGTKVYVENDQAIAQEEFPDKFEQLKYKKAGQVHFYLFGIQN